jgi:hypothetical protein
MEILRAENFIEREKNQKFKSTNKIIRKLATKKIYLLGICFWVR